MEANKCRDCIFLKKIYKHPCNTNVFNGKMSEQLGWACTVFEAMENKGFIFFDKDDGECEMFKHWDITKNPLWMSENPQTVAKAVELLYKKK